MLPAPTANIDVNASKLSCGLGILKLKSIILFNYVILVSLPIGIMTTIDKQKS
jgi:hypothetical protein